MAFFYIWPLHLDVWIHKTRSDMSQMHVRQLSRWIDQAMVGGWVGWLSSAGGLEPDLPGNEPFPRPAMDRHCCAPRATV